MAELYNKGKQRLPESAEHIEFSYMVAKPNRGFNQISKQPSKLVYVKSSEQKEREKQAELKKQMTQSQGQLEKGQMSKLSQMTKAASTMTAPQMGR
jgi:hypothetical protein